MKGLLILVALAVAAFGQPQQQPWSEQPPLPQGPGLCAAAAASSVWTAAGQGATWCGWAEERNG